MCMMSFYDLMQGEGDVPNCTAYYWSVTVSHSGVVVSKHGLYAGSLGSIPTAVTTMTAAGGDAEHVSLNH